MIYNGLVVTISTHLLFSLSLDMNIFTSLKDEGGHPGRIFTFEPSLLSLHLPVTLFFFFFFAVLGIEPSQELNH
jgi:hypothetical protein